MPLAALPAVMLAHEGKQSVRALATSIGAHESASNTLTVFWEILEDAHAMSAESKRKDTKLLIN